MRSRGRTHRHARSFIFPPPAPRARYPPRVQAGGAQQKTLRTRSHHRRAIHALPEALARHARPALIFHLSRSRRKEKEACAV